MMLEAAQDIQLDADRLSFTGCFRILQCRLPECDGQSASDVQNWYRAVLQEMREDILPPRRNRINPLRHQTQDVEVAQEATRAPTTRVVPQVLCRNSGYENMNGIAFRRPPVERRPPSVQSNNCSSMRMVMKLENLTMRLVLSLIFVSAFGLGMWLNGASITVAILATMMIWCIGVGAGCAVRIAYRHAKSV